MLVDTNKPRQLSPSKPKTSGDGVLEDWIETVARDVIVFLSKHLLQGQEEFKTAGIPFHVCVGYHCTDEGDMNDIRAKWFNA